MTDLKKITSRIQALLAKASSTEHEAEAAAFMAKAQQLLEEYQIDLGTLADNDDPVHVFKAGLQMTDKDPSWIKKLYSALGTLYGCKVVYNPMWVRNQPGFRIELTGRESSTMTTDLMFPWVKSQCYAAGRRLAKEYPSMSAAQHSRRVGNALVLRIYRLCQETKAAPKTEAAQQNALVTIDRVEQVFMEEYGEVEETKTRPISTHQAAVNAASSIGLHRQVDGSTQLALGSR
jgi:hypothetical protein